MRSRIREADDTYEDQQETDAQQRPHRPSRWASIPHRRVGPDRGDHDSGDGEQAVQPAHCTDQAHPPPREEVVRPGRELLVRHPREQGSVSRGAVAVGRQRTERAQIDRLAQAGRGPRDQRAQIAPLPRRGDAAVRWPTSEPTVVARRVDLAPDRAERVVEIASGRSPPVAAIASSTTHWNTWPPRSRTPSGRTDRESIAAARLDLSPEHGERRAHLVQQLARLSGHGKLVEGGRRIDAEHRAETCRHRRLFDVGDGQAVVRLVDALEPHRSHDDRQRDAHDAERRADAESDGDRGAGQPHDREHQTAHQRRQQQQPLLPHGPERAERQRRPDRPRQGGPARSVTRRHQSDETGEQQHRQGGIDPRAVHARRDRRVHRHRVEQQQGERAQPPRPRADRAYGAPPS